MPSENIGIIGAGIFGLAHAWIAAECGHTVTVFERTRNASGASIRNFGMIWPIGQPEQSRHLAVRSRARWLELAKEADIWVNSYGSMHLAHHADEWEVLKEFYDQETTRDIRHHLYLWDRDQAMSRCPAINSEGFLGALYSDLELCVNPTQATRAIPAWLCNRWGVKFKFDTTVVDCSGRNVKTACGQDFAFDRVIICTGHDFETLYPLHFHSMPLQKCKLQMMRTHPQPNSWQIGNHIASGLTLRHYSSFANCPSLQKVIARVSDESPELDEFGIHVMASQDNFDRVVLGDSHEHGHSIEPFDSQRINSLILRELQKIIRLPDWKIESTWHGIYAKIPGAISVNQSPEYGVFVCTGLGGAGMTMAFGIAEDNWRIWNGDL